jgi:predicted  nucleic acid-binding Zn-ribbon protein
MDKKIHEGVSERVKLDGVIDDHEKWQIETTRKYYDRSRSEHVKAAKKFMAAEQAYMNTPLGKIKQLKSTIEKGRNKIKRLLGLR